MKLNYLIALLLISTLNSFGQDKLELYFDFNQEIPTAESQKKLEHWMNENKNVEITKLMGFCDSVDTKEYNKKLAQRRINKVANILENHSIKSLPTIVKVAVGKDFRQAAIQDENRKVTIYYQNSRNVIPHIEEANDTIIEAETEIFSTQLAERFRRAKKGDLIRINNINFQFNSEKIVESSEPILINLYQIMIDNPKLRIEIHGHICCNPDGNDVKLSYRRAKYIFQFLKDEGIEMGRLGFKGFGSSRSIYPIPEKNYNEEAANRRVEILIVQNK
jgi:outer membrane protein OmpA-like peptidoglycan-associated protein